MTQNNNQNKEPKTNYQAFIQSRPILMILNLFNWPRRLIRKTYEWMLGWANTKQADRALFGFSFAESSFFPIPPDPLLITMTIARPKKWLRFGIICTGASVLGGLLGYIIGAGLFETLGRPIIEAYNLQDEFIYLGERFQENAFWAILMASFTPIPYKLFTISAGVFQVNLFVFLIASLLGRGARFLVVAWLMHQFGYRFKDSITKYIDWISIILAALIILGFMAVRYI